MASPYEIAIRMSLEDDVSGALMTLGGALTGLEGQIGRIQKLWDDMGASAKLAIGGVVGLIAGDAIIHGLNDVAEKGEKLVQVQNQLVAAGMAYNDVLNLTKEAFDNITSQVPTAAASDVLKTVLELRSVLGDTDKATAAAPFALKLDADESDIAGKEVHGEGFKLWRAMEMKGLTTSDPEGAEALINALARDILGSGGKLSASDFQAAAKSGGTAWIHASPEFLSGPGAVIAADLGGDRFGTALSTLYSTTSGAITMSRQQVEAWDRLDLLDDSKVHKLRGGSYSFDPGAIENGALAQTNPAAWAKDVLIPALDKAAGSNDEIRNDLISKIGRNKNTIRMLTMLTDPGILDQIDKDMRLWSNVEGVEDRYDTLLGRTSNAPKGVEDPAQARERAAAGVSDAQRVADYTSNIKALHEQFDSLMEAIGGPVAHALVPQIQELTKVFNSLGSFANDHPEGVAMAAKFAEGLAAAAIVLGGGAALTAMVTFAPLAASVAAGIAATAGAAALLSSVNWQSAADGIKGFVAQMEDALAKLMPNAPKHVYAPDDAMPILASNGYQRGDLYAEEQREASRGKALSAMSAASSAAAQNPNISASLTGTVQAQIAAPTVEVKNDIKVTLDGNAIAAAVAPKVEAQITQSIMGKIGGMFSSAFSNIRNGIVNGAAALDGRANPAPVDASGGAF